MNLSYIDVFFHGHAATVLVLISAFFHAGFNAALKTGQDRYVLRACASWVAAFFYIPLMFLTPFPTSIEFLMLLASALAHFLYQLLQAQSLQHADTVVGYPITRGSAPLYITLGAVLFLGESISPFVLAGAFVISLSVLASAPFHLIRNDKALQKGVFWSLLTGAGVALYTLCDAHFSRQFSNPLSFIAWFFPFNGLFMTISVLLRSKKTPLLPKIRQEKYRALRAGSIAAVSYGSVILAFYFAGNRTVEIASLRETSVVFGMILGFFFLKEKLNMRKMIAGLGILAGCFLIKIR